jgi:PAS domain S-box-containing protein
MAAASPFTPNSADPAGLESASDSPEASTPASARVPAAPAVGRGLAAWFARQRSEDGEAASATDLRRLLHGLEVNRMELERQNEELKRGRTHAEAALESITDGFFSLDREFRLTYVNPEAEKLLGRARQELLGRNLWQVFPEAVGSRFQYEYERALAKNATVHFEAFYPPFGQWFEVHAYPSAIGLSVYFKDITDRKWAEEQTRRFNKELQARLRERTATIRSLASELTLAEEIEKSRLAQVLHDHLQQALVAARFLLTSARQDTGAAGLEKLARADRILSEAVTGVRTLAVELSPPVLRKEGLAAALVRLGRWMHEWHGLSVNVVAGPKQVPLAEELSSLVYQAVRELLFNVVQHAGVMSAAVTVDCRHAQVRIVVSDEGKGFDPAHVQSVGGRGSQFGLSGLGERLALLGGRLEAESAPGRGSRFTLRLPVPRPRGKRPAR